MKMIMRMDLSCHKTVRMSLMLLNYTWNGKFYVMYILLKFKKVFTLKTAYLREHHTSFSCEEERKNVGNHWQVRKKFLGVRFHYDCPLLSKRVNCLENWSVEQWDIQESWNILRLVCIRFLHQIKWPTPNLYLRTKSKSKEVKWKESESTMLFLFLLNS